MSAPAEVVALAEQGARVFPLAPHTKKPIFSKWQLDHNSSSLTEIEQWANDYPGCNWGMLCGPQSKRWVLDFDCKFGKPGLGVYQHWIEEHGPEWTFTVRVRTASGGLHLHLPWEGAISKSIDRIADGVDVQGYGSFAVIPPSEVGGHRYAFEDSSPESDLASIPQWLWMKVKSIVIRAPQKLMNILDEEKPIHEGERHAHLIGYLINLRLSGASLRVLRFAAEDLNRRLVPPYDQAELDRQVEDIYERYRPFRRTSHAGLERHSYPDGEAWG